jgi:hypothetical protein
MQTREELKEKVLKVLRDDIELSGRANAIDGLKGIKEVLVDVQNEVSDEIEDVYMRLRIVKTKFLAELFRVLADDGIGIVDITTDQVHVTKRQIFINLDSPIEPGHFQGLYYTVMADKKTFDPLIDTIEHLKGHVIMVRFNRLDQI